jgi:hypothetical protein
MHHVPDPVVGSSLAPNAPPRREHLYTLGFTDGLGERLLLFDHGTATSLELLRFKREFSDAPAFEAALRARVEELKQFHHPSVATVRSVGRLEAGGRLVLVSNHTAGRRLSDLIPKASGPVFALELIRHVTPVLAALQRAGESIAHGALTAERIVVTREGRLVVVEHVLASALESLGLPASRMQSELGLALSTAAEPVRLDCRADVIQLGFVALSLLLGRRVDPAAYPATVEALLEEVRKLDSGGSAPPSGLLAWLERALQAGPRPFGSAQEAHDALNELPDEADAPGAEPQSTTAADHPSAESTASASGEAAPQVAPSAALTSDVAAQSQSGEADGAPKSETDEAPPVATDWQGLRARFASSPPDATLPLADPAEATFPHFSFSLSPKQWTPIQWSAAGLAALSLVEALVIVGLIYARPSNGVPAVRPPSTDGPSRAVADMMPLKPDVPSALRAPSTESVSAPTPKPAASEIAPPPTRPTPEPAAASVTRLADRFGGITVSCPIELQVFEGGKLLGSTTGPIAMLEGSHSLDLVSEALGFRTHEAANVKAGALTALTVAVPNGRISINAVPWADVWIDGKAAGQTPIANLSLAVGQHEIIFRHPQFGEQRQTTVVKPDQLARVSVTMQR